MLFFPYLLVYLRNCNHKRIIIDIVKFKKSGINFYLIFKNLFNILRQMNLLFSLNPVVILELLSFNTTSSIQWSFQVINLFYFNCVVLCNIFKYILHADKIYSIYFLLILIYFKFVKPINSNYQSISKLFHVPIIVL